MIIGGIYRGLLPVERIYRGGQLIWWGAEDCESAAGMTATLVARAVLTQEELRQLVDGNEIAVRTVVDAALCGTAVGAAYGAVRLILLGAIHADESVPAVPNARVSLGTTARELCTDSQPVHAVVDISVDTGADLHSVAVRRCRVRHCTVLEHEATARSVRSAPVGAESPVWLNGENTLASTKSRPNRGQETARLSGENTLASAGSWPMLGRETVRLEHRAQVSDSDAAPAQAAGPAVMRTEADGTDAVSRATELSVETGPGTEADLADGSLGFPSLNARVGAETSAPLRNGTAKSVQFGAEMAAEDTAVMMQPEADSVRAGQSAEMETAAALLGGDVRHQMAWAGIGIVHQTMIRGSEPVGTEIKGCISTNTEPEAADAPAVAPGLRSGIHAGTEAAGSDSAPEALPAAFRAALGNETVLSRGRTAAPMAEAPVWIVTNAAAECDEAGVACIQAGHSINASATLNTWANAVRRGSDLLILQAVRMVQDGSNLLIT